MIRGISLFVAFLFCILGCTSKVEESEDAPGGLGPPRETFSGKVGLKDSVVLPTLDTPVPPGKSAIWCATIPLAWKEYRKIAPGEIKVQDPAAAERLDHAQESTSDLPPGSYYVNAGLVENAIVGRIRREMAQKFPGKTLPDLEPPGPKGPLAYAYLQARVKFQQTFAERNSIHFQDSRGKVTAVRGFGVEPSRGDEGAKKMREQVLVYSGDARIRRVTRFAVDLCKSSAPSQVVLALVEPGPTLSETVEAVEKLLELKGESPKIGDDLHVPEVSFLVDHHFPELEGTDLQLAFQRIRFELNRFGAGVESEAVLYEPAGRDFVFDRPFLIYMRKRGSSRPFFVMWVDNAEILCP
jgi:hypothetical protein